MPRFEIVDAHVAIHHRAADHDILVELEVQQLEEADSGGHVGHRHRDMIEVLQHGATALPQRVI